MIEITVWGVPAPGGSKKALPYIRDYGESKTPFRKEGHRPAQLYIWSAGKFRPVHVGAIAVDAGKHNTAWKRLVANAARLRMTAPLEGPLGVTFHFFMPRPKSHYRTGKFAGKLKESAQVLHTVRPDYIKLVRSTEDALNGIAWYDDSQIAHSVALKQYVEEGGRPCAKIVIEQLNPKLFQTTK